MAEVKMDLAELEAIKQSVVDEKAKVQEQIKKYQELEKEVIGIKADKRVVKITKTVNATIPSGTIRNAASEALHRAQSFYSGIHDRLMSFEDNFISLFESKLRSGIGTWHAPDVTEFVNFDDVREVLRQELEKQFGDELASLRTDKRNSNITLAELTKKYTNELDSLNKDHTAIVVKMQQEYEDLKNDKDTRATEIKLQEQIDKLTEELKAEKAKKWYQKL